jgi:translation elongation factor EF-Tu-like GTPase
MVSFPRKQFEFKIWGILHKRAGGRIAPKMEFFSCRFSVRFLKTRGQITTSKIRLVKVLASNRASLRPQPLVVPAG